MGFDRFCNFISRSISNEGIEEVNINNNVRKMVCNHVIFDVNFLIYQEVNEIEDEINTIIKIILSLPFASFNGELLENIIKNIFSQSHWKPYYTSNLEKIFDGINEEEIIKNFNNYITSKITYPLSEEKETNGLSIIEMVLFEKIYNIIVNYINKIHHVSLIQNVSLFFDGIPSFSKVIEQRRRRLKNYLESIEKKILFKEYFSDLYPKNEKLSNHLNKKYGIIGNNILFDYFKWVNYRFCMDKSFGPVSNFVINLETFLKQKLEKDFPKIYINSSKENGESDVKIFKFISNNDNNNDYCIHTTDSDLIHQMLVQQAYYKIINRDINISVCRYLKNQNGLGYAQILEGNLIIKNILDIYNSINNIKTSNYKIIWDLCLLFYFFGNDHLSSSYDIGPELGLEFFLKNHYLALQNGNIIGLKKTFITFDLKLLGKYLEMINENHKLNHTKILLSRFFKINYNFINLLVDKMGLDFDGIQKFLKNFIIYKSLTMSDDDRNKLNPNDLRLILINEFSKSTDSQDNKVEVENPNLSGPDTLKEKNFVFPFNDKLCLSNETIEAKPQFLLQKASLFDETIKKIVEDNCEYIHSNINYYEHKYNGLELYNKNMFLTNDPYQDLYNFITEKASMNLSKINSNLHDFINYDTYLNINNNYDVNDYLKKIYHLSCTQFGNMKDYNSNNITFYKYNSSPPISDIINFINLNDNNKVRIWLKEFLADNLSETKYLNSINHHLIITPYLLSYSLPDEIKLIINKINMDNLILNKVDNFDYRNFDISKFLKQWEEALIQIKLLNKNDNINNQVFNLSYNYT
jgi:predicted nuclease of predicted toxin-antitoxin system